MTDEVNNQTMVFAISVGRVTATILRDLMRDYLHSRRPGSRIKHKTVARGRLTLKKLQESRAELTSIAISDDNIKSFQKYARKYNVTYALKKDKQTGKYYVFFKARDADSLHAAMSEFVAKKTLDKEKPTLKVRLAEKIKQADLLKRQKKVKHKRREVER